MPLIGHPTPSVDQLRDDDFFRQHWQMGRKRWMMLGNGERWPHASEPWSGGVVTSLVSDGAGNYVLTDETKALPPEGETDGPNWWDGNLSLIHI